jgi:hypothetical protein
MPWRCFHGNNIERVLDLGTVDQEGIRVPHVVLGKDSPSIRADALRTESDAAINQPPRLALRPHEFVRQVEYEVVSMVGPNGTSTE